MLLAVQGKATGQHQGVLVTANIILMAMAVVVQLEAPSGEQLEQQPAVQQRVEQQPVERSLVEQQERSPIAPSTLLVSPATVKQIPWPRAAQVG